MISAACSTDAVPAPSEASSEVPSEVLFTVRGRWGDAPVIRWIVDKAPGPVGREVLREAVRRAAAQWGSAGGVTFAPATDGEADVAIGWKRGVHGPCPPFGSDARVAHSGPSAPGTFVHLDADRAWTAESLQRTVLHELGHILGLGHTDDVRAVMYAEMEPPRAALTDSDRAGLASLYGGWLDGPGDVTIRGAGAPVLRRVAPSRTTELAVFDTDGDGDDELVVWRTDPAGHGAVMAYHFAAGPRLAATVGPALGMVAPGARVVLGKNAGGDRALVSIYPGGRLVARRFAEGGRFEPWPASGHLVLDSGVLDDDGDGWLDEGAAIGKPASPLRGDLDGDGALDELVRRP